MKQIEAPAKPIYLKPDPNSLRYDRRTVEFLCDLGSELLLLTGRFVVGVVRGLEHVDIHYKGRLDPRDPPCSDYCFHLSEAHLRSTVPATRPGSQVDFLMEKPLLPHDWIRQTA
jgi:hypothetical protein